MLQPPANYIGSDPILPVPNLHIRVEFTQAFRRTGRRRVQNSKLTEKLHSPPKHLVSYTVQKFNLNRKIAVKS